MLKYVKKITALLLIAALLCVPAFAARIVENFYFKTVAYDWGGGDTDPVIKDNESSAVVNTLASAGGSVSPSQLFNTRVALWMGGPEVVGHKWACNPNAREYIPYDFSNLAGYEIYAQFSTRSVGATATMDGSWSPDSW